MATLTGWLVVDGAKSEMRLTKRRPRLCSTEVAFPITVRLPRTPWGTVLGQGVDLTVPESAVPTFDAAAEPITPEGES